MSDLALMIGSFALLLLARVPVAFALGLSATLTMLRSIPPEPSLVTVAQRLATSLDSFALLAIPLFVLAGEIMNRGGIARRLVDLARWMLGGLPAGLAHVHVLASMLFGAISGSAKSNCRNAGACPAASSRSFCSRCGTSSERARCSTSSRLGRERPVST